MEIWQPCDRAAGSYTPDPTAASSYVPPDGTPPAMAYRLATNGFSLDKRAVPGACAAGGLGFLCDYVVRVTNTGPDAYVGPIVVNEQLPAQPAGAVMTLADSPPWLCFAISPTEQQCTYGPAVAPARR